MQNSKQKIYKFLRWSQKYTRTDNVYLLKGGFWLILGRMIFMISSFLLALAFANLLDPTTFGNYKYILSLTRILAVFTLTGMTTAIIQAVARNMEGSFYSAFKIKLKWGLLGSLAAIIGAIYYWLRGNYILPIPLLITAVFLPLMWASQIYGAFLTGKKLFDIKTKYRTINQIIFVGLMVITLFLTKNLFWLIAVYFVSHTFLNYFFYFLTKSKLKPNRKEDPQTISYGKHLSLMNVINSLASHLDQILLFTLVGSTELAIYSFAVLIPEQIHGVLGSINALALPKLVSRSREEIKKNIIQKLWKLCLLTGTMITAYILIVPYIYKIFFPKYLSSIPYSQIFIFTLLSLPTSLLGTIFQAKMMKKELYVSRTVALIRIILFAVLIPLYGLWGLIIAKVGAEVFSFGLILFLFRKF